MKRLVCPEDRGKVKRMLEFANVNRDVDDPWYTGNFDATWDDVLVGCAVLLKALQGENAPVAAACSPVRGGLPARACPQSPNEDCRKWK